MADVTFEGSSDFDRVKRDFDSLHKETVKLREANKKLNDDAKKGSREQASGFETATASLKNHVNSMVNLQTVIGFVTSAYSKLREEQAKLANDSQKVQKSLLHNAVGAGDAAQLPQIEKWIDTAKGVSRDQAVAAYGGISGAMPDAPLAKRQRMADATFAAAVLSGGNMQGFGALVGDFAGYDAKATPEMVVSKTVRAQQLAGDKAGQLGSDEFKRAIGMMMHSGMSEDQAIGLGLAALGSDVSPSTLGIMAGKVGESREMIRPNGRPLTPTELAKNRFTAASEAERWELIGGDQSIQEAELGIRNVGQAGLIDRKMATENAALYREASRRNIVPDEIAALAKSKTGREALFEQKELADSNSTPQQKEEEEARAWARLDTANERILKNRGGNFLGKALDQLNYNISKFGVSAEDYGNDRAFLPVPFNTDERESLRRAASPRAEDFAPLTKALEDNTEQQRQRNTPTIVVSGLEEP